MGKLVAELPLFYFWSFINLSCSSPSSISLFNISSRLSNPISSYSSISFTVYLLDNFCPLCYHCTEKGYIFTRKKNTNIKNKQKEASHMRLKEYLKLKGLKYREFCLETGISLSVLQDYINGIRLPRIDRAYLIEKHTQGHVKAKLDDWPLLNTKEKKAVDSKASKAKNKKTKT